MAKLPFSKLNKIKAGNEISVMIEDNSVSVKQYLPLEEKLDLMIAVLENAGADEGYFNMVKLKVFYVIEMLRSFTNISFTEKQLSEPSKLYDGIMLNGVWTAIETAIPQSEAAYIWNSIITMAKAITDYNRSFAGMFSILSKDYSHIDGQLSDIQSKLKSEEILEMIKRVLPEAGLTN